MNKFNFYRIALLTVTLFLFGGFSGGVFAQSNINNLEKVTAQNTAPDTKQNSFSVAKDENRPKFFAHPANANPSNASRQTATTYIYPDSKDRFRKYVKRTIGGTALLGDVFSAGFAQLTDSPEEWENNSKGFGRRLASTFGRSVIRETVIYGLDESFKLDSNYYKSGGSKNLKNRVKNAFLSTFTARKPDGKRVFGFPRIIGTYTSAIIANQFWYPSNYNYKDGFSSGTISLGVNVGVNFVREFF